MDDYTYDETIIPFKKSCSKWLKENIKNLHLYETDTFEFNNLLNQYHKNSYFYDFLQEIDKSCKKFDSQNYNSSHFKKAYMFPLKSLLTSSEYIPYRELYNIKNYRKNLKDDEIRDIPINISKEHTVEFLKYIIKKVNNDKFESFFFTGSRGEGKTTFLNYLLIRHKRMLYNQGIIPIVLDYTATKIIFKDFKINILKALLRKVKEDEKTKMLLIEKVEDSGIRRFLQDKHKGASLDFLLDDIDKYSGYIKKITKYLESEKRFLFIIDGLDNFNRDYSSNKVFEERSEEISDFIIHHTLNNTCNIGAFLFITRKESYQHILRLSQKGNARIIKRKNFILLPISSMQIGNSKFILLGMSIKNKAKHSDFQKQLLKLRSFFYRYIKRNFIKPEINILESFFDKNNRNITNAIYALLRDMLYRIEYYGGKANTYDEAIEKLNDLLENTSQRERFLNSSEWLAYRSLLLNRYHMVHARYEYVKEKKEKRKKKRKLNFMVKIKESSEEFSLIPNIYYNYNLFSFADDKKIIKNNNIYTILIKIRILQLYKLKGKRTPSTIVKILLDYFKYPTPLIMSEIRMLYAYGLIKKVSSHTANEFNYEPFEISSTGLVMVDNLAFKYYYLEAVLDNTRMNSDFFDKYIMPISRLYFANSAEEVAKGMARKILQTLAFAHYIEHIESLEIEHFKKNSLNNFFSYKKDSLKNDLLISRKIFDEVDLTIKRILSSPKPFIKKDVLENIQYIINSRI